MEPSALGSLPGHVQRTWTSYLFVPRILLSHHRRSKSELNFRGRWSVEEYMFRIRHGRRRRRFLAECDRHVEEEEDDDGEEEEEDDEKRRNELVDQESSVEEDFMFLDAKSEKSNSPSTLSSRTTETDSHVQSSNHVVWETPRSVDFLSALSHSEKLPMPEDIQQDNNLSQGFVEENYSDCSLLWEANEDELGDEDFDMERLIPLSSDADLEDMLSVVDFDPENDGEDSPLMSASDFVVKVRNIFRTDEFRVFSRLLSILVTPPLSLPLERKNPCHIVEIFCRLAPLFGSLDRIELLSCFTMFLPSHSQSSFQKLVQLLDISLRFETVPWPKESNSVPQQHILEDSCSSRVDIFGPSPLTRKRIFGYSRSEEKSKSEKPLSSFVKHSHCEDGSPPFLQKRPKLSPASMPTCV